MIAELQRITIREGLCLGELLTRMNEGSSEILLLVGDDYRLIRTITDGDLRRLLLEGVALEEVEFVLPKKAPITALEGTEGEIILQFVKKPQQYFIDSRNSHIQVRVPQPRLRPLHLRR